jgi:hypothetical protein
MRNLLPLLALCAGLGACATETVYAPARNPGGPGFTESRIEQDRWRISFHGGAGAPPQQVEDYALLRAAQLALANGYDWFAVDERHMAQTGYSGASLGLGIGGMSFGRHSAVGGGVSSGVPLSGGPELTAYMEVRFGRGAKPDQPNAYDAHDVERTVGPRVPNPPAPPR